MTERQPKSIVTLFYQGGTKVQFKSPVERATIEAELNAARKESRDAKLEEVNTNPEVGESFMFAVRGGMLFYNIMTIAEKPLIQPIGGKIELAR